MMKQINNTQESTQKIQQSTMQSTQQSALQYLLQLNLKVCSFQLKCDQNGKKIPKFQNGWKNNKQSNIKPNDNGFYMQTGKLNNITVIDIDDPSTETNQKIIQQIEKLCPTLTEKTGKGLHYYFQYNDKLTSTINTDLKLDILNNDKIVFCAPTEYKKFDKLIQYELINKNKINVLHQDVQKYIIELNAGVYEKIDLKIDNDANNKNNKKITPNRCSNQKFFIPDYKLNKYLQDLVNLSAEWVNNYSKWLIICSICKNLNKFKIFDKWSKKSSHYNYNQNVQIWNHNKGLIDINYLNFVLHNPKIHPYKDIQKLGLPENINAMQLIEQYINLEYEIYQKNDTIILQSDTGTGKTTDIAKNVKEIMIQSPEYYLISIVPRISLANQHIKNFKQNGIRMLDYQTIDKTNLEAYTNKNIVCCINSLLLLKDYDFGNAIVFLDEITSFLQSCLGNPTIVEQRLIFQLLTKIIKQSKKVIVSDATIFDNVFICQRNRNNATKILIQNDYKVNKGKEAFQINDEGLFFEKLQEQVQQNKYFLCCSDSASQIIKIYNHCKKYGNNPDDFILITAESGIQIYDAEIQFKNKFVFYSPSITYGVDYKNEQKSNVYMYIKGDSLDPLGFYQQLNRTRNIDTLFFYINPKIKHSAIKYQSFEHCKNHLKECALQYNDKILANLCVQQDETDDLKVIENTFFKLYCHNEYQKDIYNNNKEAHFLMLLQEKGFELNDIGQFKQLDKQQKKQQDEEVKQNIENSFEEFKQDFSNQKYAKFEERRQILNLEVEQIDDYKEQITDKFKFEEHLDIIDFYKSDEIINKKIEQLNKQKYDVVAYNHKYIKIKVLREITQKYLNENIIKENNLNYDDKNVIMNIDEDDYKLLKQTFRYRGQQIKNLHDFNKLHINMIRSIAPIVISKKKGKGVKQYYHYEYDIELINFHTKLAQYRQNKCQFD